MVHENECFRALYVLYKRPHSILNFFGQCLDVSRKSQIIANQFINMRYPQQSRYPRKG
jgi:hypothetical protein